MVAGRGLIRPAVSFVFLLATVRLSSPVKGQSDVTGEELRVLQRQIDELQEAQKSMQEDLQEIKAALQGRAGAPNLPPPNLTVSLDNRPFKGQKDAKLTLIEFSDYQCPFCMRFFKETLPIIEREYIATGKLKYVVRDFPLEAIHRNAFKAHEAANCASEEGKYWEMHDRLFYNQNLLGAAELPKHAQAIGLSLSRFQQCLEGGKYASQIRQDIEEGRKAGVNGTPTFFSGVEDSGDGQSIKVLRMIVGAQPYAQFKQAIEGALRQIQK